MIGIKKITNDVVVKRLSDTKCGISCDSCDSCGGSPCILSSHEDDSLYGEFKRMTCVSTRKFLDDCGIDTGDHKYKLSECYIRFGMSLQYGYHVYIGVVDYIKSLDGSACDDSDDSDGDDSDDSDGDDSDYVMRDGVMQLYYEKVQGYQVHGGYLHAFSKMKQCVDIMSVVLKMIEFVRENVDEEEALPAVEKLQEAYEKLIRLRVLLTSDKTKEVEVLEAKD